MQYTSNYNLAKPDANDQINPLSREAYNDNFTNLDTLLKDIDNDIDDVREDISDVNAKTGDDIPFERESPESISDKITILYNLLVPVGSVLCFTNDANPNDIYQGTTWEKIEGRFLLGSSPDYALGSTGGSADAVVVEHTHAIGSAGQAGSGTTTYGTVRLNAEWASQTSGVTGVNGTGKNMPPYEVVNYWKRIA